MAALHIAYLSCMVTVLPFKLVIPFTLKLLHGLLVIVGLLIEFIVPQCLLSGQLLTVSFHHFGELLLIPTVKSSVFIYLSFNIGPVCLFHLLALTKPGLLFFVNFIAQVCVVLVAQGHFLVCLLCPSIQFIKMDGLCVGSLTLLLLDSLHQLINLVLQLLL